jgi:hypothetical protein
MTSVADAARPVGATTPPVRHGTCRLTIRIAGIDYALKPLPPEAGVLAAWILRKQDPHHSACYLVAAPKGKPPHCSCPDHERSGWTCKHIGALTAAGLIPAPKPPSARNRKLHARNARKAIAEANALPAEDRRHLAEIVAPPPEDFAAGFRAAIRDELARIGGTPAQPRPALCELCGDPFDPAASHDPRYCTECREGGAL